MHMVTYFSYSKTVLSLQEENFAVIVIFLLTVKSIVLCSITSVQLKNVVE